jgi:hypothetical protein
MLQARYGAHLLVKGTPCVIIAIPSQHKVAAAGHAPCQPANSQGGALLSAAHPAAMKVHAKI